MNKININPIAVPSLSLTKIMIDNISSESLAEVKDTPDKPITEPRLYQNRSIAPVATPPPMVSSLHAQLRTDLWQQYPSGVGYFQHRAKGNPNNIIEHYIASPGDITLLPLDEAMQIIDKFGLTAAKLHLIFAAHIMRQEEPWKSLFTIEGSDLIKEMGWDKRTDLPVSQKLNEIAKTSYALGCLAIKATWVEGKHKKGGIRASVDTSRMWNVQIQLTGQQNLEGKIEHPDEVYITVQPGLWTHAFLNKAGCFAKEALYQFGYLAQDILKIDAYHDEMALRLALHLTMESRFHTSGIYKVETLLQALLPQTVIDLARSDRKQTYKLTNNWNRTLEVLLKLKRGFQIEFDQDTYPEWLRPGSKSRKKSGYFDTLLAAKITIHPPAPIPKLLATKAELKQVQPRLKASPKPKLTSNEIKEARVAKGWSQAQLAGWLGMSQRYVSMLERGERIPAPEVESRIWHLLITSE
jgi:DNA-binding transcriptional regulator YiaG